MKRILLFGLTILLVCSCSTPGQRSTNGIWLWSKYMNEVNLDTLAAKDIDNIFLHEVAFTSHGTDSTLAFIKEARSKGLLVHVWFQCFYFDGKWVSPVDDENNCYKQEYFDRVIKRAEDYVDMGVEAIHLDYIRFGGTAYKHNPSDSITATGAVTEFCRQISTSLKAKNPDVILSAALMPEIESQYYYGQDPQQMGQYLDILIPMIYRYSPSYRKLGEKWPVESANYFATKGAPAKVWAGTTTYDGGDEGQVRPLSADEIAADCRDFIDNSKAEGVVLFRYGLGEIPDLNGLKKEKAQE